MSIPLEHDYIGLTTESSSSLERSSEKSILSSSSSTNDNIQKHDILKETQLCLGLPGFSKNSLHNIPLKSFVSGAKRGFSDTNDDESAKWGFPVTGSVADSGHVSVLLSPRGGGGLGSSISRQPSLPHSSKLVEDNKSSSPVAKGAVVGWPPIRSFRKNTMATNLSKNNGAGITEEGSNSGTRECLYVKVSMDGAPFLRKVDLKTYSNYAEFSFSLRKMFNCFTRGHCTSSNGLPGEKGVSESRSEDLLHGSECVLAYEDKDGDWMLVGDVPWEMFTESCKRLRIMKGSEAIGLAPRAMKKCNNGN